MVAKYRNLWSSRATRRKGRRRSGFDLIIFYSFPSAISKLLRTTSSIENLNREFRCKINTQRAFSSEEATIISLFLLFAFCQIELREITGYEHVAELLNKQ